MDLFITRCAINRHRRQARRFLESPQVMHAAVLSCFLPDAWDHLDSDAGRALWRLDNVGSGLYLHLVSPIKPDMTSFVEQAGWPDQPECAVTKNYAPFVDALLKGGTYSFRFVGNPVRAVSADARNGRGKRVPISGNDKRLEWLERRFQQCGLEIPDVASGDEKPECGAAVMGIRKQEFLRRRGDKEMTVTFSQVAFEGLVTVADAEAARKALRLGIGPSKAYGCGLLTLSPVHG